MSQAVCGTSTVWHGIPAKTRPKWLNLFMLPKSINLGKGVQGERRLVDLAKQVSSQKRTQGSSGFFRTLFQQRELALMVIPGIIIVFIFNYIPIYGIVIAFQNYNPVAGFFGSDWVGLKYFTQFFHDPFLGRLLRNTLL